MPKAKNKNIDVDAMIDAMIKKAVNAGIEAGRREGAVTAGNAYKETEKRLYAYPVLIQKIADDKEKIIELSTHGAPGRSKSLVRFSTSGGRIDPEEKLDALIKDLQAVMARDQHEVDTIAGALDTIAKDPFYSVIAGKFIHLQADDEIAASIPCDPSTVRRNRGRLIRRLAVWLYGAQAL